MMSRRRFGMAAGGLCALLLAGCDTLGNPLDAMSPKREGPDAFQVVARKELRMPPSTGPEALAMPRPGAPSPLEPDPHAEAAAALFGSGAAATASADRMGRAEAALIGAIPTGEVDPAEAARLAARVEAIEADRPYEPPSVVELLSFSTAEKVDPDLVLDSAAEAARLQQGGLRAPSDPAAAAPEGAAPPREAFIAERNFPYGPPREVRPADGRTPSPVDAGASE